MAFTFYQEVVQRVGCLDHFGLGSDIQNMLHFKLKDCDNIEDVITVLLDTKQETVDCNNDTGILKTLLCVHSALALDVPEVHDRIPLLENIYHEVLRDMPSFIYLNVCKEKCLLMDEINKVIMKVIQLVYSSPVYAPFVGQSFDVHIQGIKSKQYHYSEYLIVMLLHNIVSFLKEIHFERRHQELILSPEEEIFYVEIPNKLTKPKSTLPKYILVKVVKKQIVQREHIHVYFLNSYLRLPETLQNEWSHRCKSIFLDLPTKCCVCLEPFENNSLLGYLSGCLHSLCISCIEELVKRNKVLTCPMCRKKSEDYICAPGFAKLCSTFRN